MFSILLSLANDTQWIHNRGVLMYSCCFIISDCYNYIRETLQLSLLIYKLFTIIGWWYFCWKSPFPIKIHKHTISYIYVCTTLPFQQIKMYPKTFLDAIINFWSFYRLIVDQLSISKPKEDNLYLRRWVLLIQQNICTMMTNGSKMPLFAWNSSVEIDFYLFLIFW